jgi:hypothetical protein
MEAKMELKTNLKNLGTGVLSEDLEQSNMVDISIMVIKRTMVNEIRNVFLP